MYLGKGLGFNLPPPVCVTRLIKEFHQVKDYVKNLKIKFDKKILRLL